MRGWDESGAFSKTDADRGLGTYRLTWNFKGKGSEPSVLHTEKLSISTCLICLHRCACIRWSTKSLIILCTWPTHFASNFKHHFRVMLQVNLKCNSHTADEPFFSSVHYSYGIHWGLITNTFKDTIFPSLPPVFQLTAYCTSATITRR